jgi:Fe-S cluster assembly ATPase SufC
MKMYQIEYTDGSGHKDVRQLCDVRMNIVMQHKQYGRVAGRVLLDGEDVTAMALEGLPV